jgi:hypothetical protein
LIGVGVVFAIARRLGASFGAAVVVALCYIFMPIVVNLTHEAKPHLPGAVLILMACLAADRSVERNSGRWGVAAGAACGAAMGMVLWGVWCFAILPVMALGRTRSWGARLRIVAQAAAAGVLVYCVSNPYVPINLLRDPGVVRSNLGNTAEMFHAAGWAAQLPRAAGLVAEAASVPIACVGAAAALLGLFQAGGRACESPDSSAVNVEKNPGTHKLAFGLGWLIAAPATLMLVQFFAMSAGKSAEVARFAVLPCIALLLAAGAGATRWCRPALRRATLRILLLGSGAGGVVYLGGFLRDAGPRTTRRAAADHIWELQQEGARTVAVWAEPAPYGVPPVDLFHTRLLLLPPEYALDAQHAPADVVARAVDIEPRHSGDNAYAWWSPPRWSPFPSRISWADKAFEVGERGSGK